MVLKRSLQCIDTAHQRGHTLWRRGRARRPATRTPVSLDTDKIDQLIQFALACAAEAGDNDDDDEAWKDRALLTTELIKYVYLGDLAHAQATGETWTGAAWEFFHFGPWTSEVSDRLEPATIAVGGEVTRLDGGGCRFRVIDGGTADALATRHRIPARVTGAIRKAVRLFGSRARNDLLHLVYSTEPMRRAAPGERLDFQVARVEGTHSEPSVGLSRKAEKKIQTALAEARQRRAKVARPRLVEVRPPPDDDLHRRFVQALDELAGGAVPEFDAEATIDPDYWKSPARTGDP